MVKHTISGSCTKPDAEGEPCNPIVKNLLIRNMLMKSLYWLCCSTSYFLDVLVHAVVVSHAEVPIQTHSRIGLWLWWSQWLSIMVWIQTSSLWPPCGKIICFCLCRQWIKKHVIKVLIRWNKRLNGHLQFWKSFYEILKVQRSNKFQDSINHCCP